MSRLQQRGLYQAIRSAVRTSLGILRRQRASLPEEVAPLIDQAVASEKDLLDRLAAVTTRRIQCDRIRTHGDYHLGQVLFTGDDFYIIDFEGEPQRPLSQRRLKRLALRDVAGMIRSYHYAMVMALRQVSEAGVDEVGEQSLTGWANVMHQWLSGSFLKAYLDAVDGSPIVPADPGHVRLLLDALIIEKAAYELEYEANNRPDWVGIPLRGILNMIG